MPKPLCVRPTLVINLKVLDRASFLPGLLTEIKSLKYYARVLLFLALEGDPGRVFPGIAFKESAKFPRILPIL